MQLFVFNQYHLSFHLWLQYVWEVYVAVCASVCVFYSFSTLFFHWKKPGLAKSQDIPFYESLLKELFMKIKTISWYW